MRILLIKLFGNLLSLFSEKGSTHNKITLIEQVLILDESEIVAEVLNNFFVNVVSNLNIPKYHDKSVNIDHNEDPIARSIELYKNHPNIVAIKSKTTNKYFKFTSISRYKLRRRYWTLTYRKHVKIPIYQQKLSNLLNTDIFTNALYSEFNRSLETSVFHH